MATTNSDTAASQGASSSGAIGSAGGTATNASAAGAHPSGTSVSGGGGPAQLIVRPPLDVYKKLAIVRLFDDEVMYQNADGSWGKVTNLDETRIANKKKEEGKDGDDDAKMSKEADDKKSAAEDADNEEKKDEEVSFCRILRSMQTSDSYFGVVLFNPGLLGANVIESFMTQDMRELGRFVPVGGSAFSASGCRILVRYRFLCSPDCIQFSGQYLCI